MRQLVAAVAGLGTPWFREPAARTDVVTQDGIGFPERHTSVRWTPLVGQFDGLEQVANLAVERSGECHSNAQVDVVRTAALDAVDGRLGDFRQLGQLRNAQVPVFAHLFQFVQVRLHHPSLGTALREH